MVEAESAPKIVPIGMHRKLARAISAAENGYKDVWPPEAERTAPPLVLGITGPPGAGKSTITDRLIEALRARNETVAVIAVDPSSPFTHGAVLGDRVRMQRHSGDQGVFIRSMASREAAGGLAPTTREALKLIGAAGFDVAIVETVGVGQVELEVVSVADIIAVVTVPALGDGVQAIKAGVTEIADIFVVNMADRPGANATATELKMMVRESGRDVGVVQTIGTQGTGIPELIAEFDRAGSRRGERVERAIRFDVLRHARDLASRRSEAALTSSAAGALIAGVDAGTVTRDQAVAQLVALAFSEECNVD
jgi:LAO/AO transport system kinase